MCKLPRHLRVGVELRGENECVCGREGKPVRLTCVNILLLPEQWSCLELKITSAECIAWRQGPIEESTGEQSLLNSATSQRRGDKGTFSSQQNCFWDIGWIFDHLLT